MKSLLLCVCHVVLLCSILPAVLAVNANEQDVLLYETFESLEQWEPLELPNADKQSAYCTTKDGENSVLVTESSASASWLVLQKRYNVYDYPILAWRWKVQNVFDNGDLARKKYDDSPLRLYVCFEYNPKEAGLLTRMQYSTYKSLYGRYPPHSSVCYIWANRQHDKDIMPNVHNKRTRLILMEHGSEKTRRWINERVNVVQDYQRAFGAEPPPQATLAIMNDSDNTGEKAVSFIDDIVVRAKE